MLEQLDGLDTQGDREIFWAVELVLVTLGGKPPQGNAEIPERVRLAGRRLSAHVRNLLSLCHFKNSGPGLRCHAKLATCMAT
jgi:hypothetical protein